MKSSLLLIVFVCLLQTSCQSHRRQAANQAAAVLGVLNQMAALDIEHERQGAPPPQGFASWPIYWQQHFATLRYVPPKHEKANAPMRSVGNEHLLFVKVRRAGLGLPPFDS